MTYTTIAVFFTSILVSTSANFIIKDEHTVTNHGSWGPWEHCPYGTVAVGYQIKVEDDLGYYIDDSCLNGIRLFCGPPGGVLGQGSGNKYFKSFRDGTVDLPSISSSIGAYGSWRSIYLLNGTVTGYCLRVGKAKTRTWQGDEVGASNIKFFFITLKGETRSNWQTNRGTHFGDFLSLNHCPPGHAISGIRTQVQPDQGPQGDDTSLNNVAFECIETTIPWDRSQ